MKTDSMTETAEKHLPIACILPGEEQSSRAEEGTQLFESVQQIKELPDGFTFSFPGENECVDKVLEFVRAERACCPFFTFELTFEPGQGPIWLTLRGPEGTKDFIKGFLNI